MSTGTRPANPHAAARSTYLATREQRRAGDSSLGSALTAVANSAAAHGGPNATGESALYAVFESRCERVQTHSPMAFAACPTGVEQAHWTQVLADLDQVTELDWVDALRCGLPMTAVGRITGNLWIEGLIRSGSIPAGLTEDEWIDALDHLWHTDQAQWINALLYLRDISLADEHASPLICYIRDAIARPAQACAEAWNDVLESIRWELPDIDPREIEAAWKDPDAVWATLFSPGDRVAKSHFIQHRSRALARLRTCLPQLTTTLLKRMLERWDKHGDVAQMDMPRIALAAQRVLDDRAPWMSAEQAIEHMDFRGMARAMEMSAYRSEATLTERFEWLEQHAPFHPLPIAHAIESDARPVLQMTLVIASTWLPPPLRKSRLVRALTPAIPDPRPALNASKIVRAIAELGTGILAIQAIANHLRPPRCMPLSIPVSPADRHYGETTLEVLDDEGFSLVVPGRERIAMIKHMPANYDNDYRARAIAFLDAQRAE